MYNLVEYQVGSIPCWFFIHENHSVSDLFKHWNKLPIRSKVKSFIKHDKRFTYEDVENFKEEKGGFKEELKRVHFPSVDIEILV